jgi:hypothetical protein
VRIMLENVNRRLAVWGVAALLLPLLAGVVVAQGLEEEAPVAITATASPVRAAPGEVVTVSVTAVIAPEYHIYGLPPAPEMTWPTQLVVLGPAGFAAEGETSAPPAKAHEDDTQGGAMVEWYQGTVTFTLDVRVPATAPAGTISLKVGLDHMACTEEYCLDSAVLETTAELEILAGGASAIEDPATTALVNEFGLEALETEIACDVTVECCECRLPHHFSPCRDSCFHTLKA